jgi:hypothetical protein
VETANVNGFSSTTQMDGRVTLKRQSHLPTKPLGRTHNGWGETWKKSVSIAYAYAYARKRASDKMALASTLCNSDKSASPLRTDWLYSSAWSCRTGKRMESSFCID